MWNDFTATGEYCDFGSFTFAIEYPDKFGLPNFFCRSTVHSSTIPPSSQKNLTSYQNRQIAEQASTNFRSMDASSGNPSKVSRPPPRVPTGVAFSLFVALLPFFAKPTIMLCLREF